ncbi:cilia- and flagella-associated protein 119-like [Schistocerca gregaria]|uniref:cilia- and flagella-associated protein 119-like n=1 Tax=Schistocerca gregaria TaxID=7010 RepID=UPI00211E13A4|nr:cilia- and flagella-associated protein 119-like [Schistocerca gregaria]
MDDTDEQNFVPDNSSELDIQQHSLLILRERDIPKTSPLYFSTPSCVEHYITEERSLWTKKGEFVCYKEDTRVDPPRICIWNHLSKDDVHHLKLMNFKKDEVSQRVERIMLQDRIPGSRKLLTELLVDVLHFGRRNGFNDKKISSIFSIFLLTYEYFAASLWRTTRETYNYFRESILLHTIQRPPKSAEIFEPHECRLALIYFCKVYLRYLPLLHTALLPNYKLHITWDELPELEKITAKKK